MSVVSRSARGLLVASVALLSLVVAGIPAVATGSSGPAYRADIAPGGAPAGTSSTLIITVQQLSGSHDKKVHSVRVTAPAGIKVTDASAAKGGQVLPVEAPTSDGVVTVNNIPFSASGQIATITLDVAIRCGVGGSKAWSVVAQKANTFSGSGSALALDPASQLTTSISRCSLRFVEEQQPADAGRDKVITSVPADPSGTRIKVRLRDGAGDLASQAGVTISLAIKDGTGASGATLGGDRTADTNEDGVAVFAPKLDRTADDYRLMANADGVDSDTSGEFDISDVAVVCDGGCSGTSSKGGTTASVDAVSSGGVLTFSLGTGSVDCDNKTNLWYKGTSAPVVWDVTSGTGRTTIEIELARADVTRSFLLYEVCFSSPVSRFKNIFGKWIEPGEAGLLPLCLLTIRRSDQPCLVAKWIDRDRDVHVRFSVPPGDPRGRI